MTPTPERWHQITTHHEKLRADTARGWTPTHQQMVQYLEDQEDLIRACINRRNP